MVGLQKIKVSFPDGETLGLIRQTRGNNCNPGFILTDSNMKKIIHAKGPKCSICDRLSYILSVICCCFSCLIEDDVFYFVGRMGERIAEVRKTPLEIPYGYTSVTKIGDTIFKSELPEYYVTIEFIEGLAVTSKALVLAASFVIVSVYVTNFA
jgi:hypothetical protein